MQCFFFCFTVTVLLKLQVSVRLIPYVCASFSCPSIGADYHWQHTPIPSFHYSKLQFVWFALRCKPLSFFRELCSATLRPLLTAPSHNCLIFLLFSSASSQIVVWGCSRLLVLSRKNICFCFLPPCCFDVISKKRGAFYFSSVLKEEVSFIWFWNALLEFVLFSEKYNT